MPVTVVACQSHVMKLLRNMLQNKKIINMSQEWADFWELPTTEIKWEHILAVVKFQEDSELLIAPKLTRKVLKKSACHFGKMSVSCAMSIFSKDVSACMEFMVLHCGFDESFLTTAMFIFQVASWFAIISCRNLTYAFSLKNPERHEEQCKFLIDNTHFICTLQIKSNINEPQSHALTEVQQGVAITNYSMLWLQNYFVVKHKILDNLKPGYKSGDPVESLHGQARGMNKNPTSLEVERINKALAVCQVFGKIRGSNVIEDDSTEILCNFKNIKKLELDNLREEQAEVEEDITFFKTELPELFDLDTDKGFAEANALGHFVGYCLNGTIRNKRKNGSYCEKCISIFVAPQDENINQMVNELTDCKSMGGSRHYTKVSEFGNKVFYDVERLFRENRDSYFNNKKMDKKLQSFILDEMNSKYELPCHFKRILSKFLFARVNFWAVHMNQHSKVINEEAVEEVSNASRTARSMYVIE